MANKENIQKWLEALRSGSFVQGKGRLKYNIDGGVKYCCLGVACDVAIANGVVLNVNDLPFNNFVIDKKYYFDGYGESLPPKVQIWLGIDDEDPQVTSDYSAAGLNDSGNYSFAEIADMIEEKYLSV